MEAVLCYVPIDDLYHNNFTEKNIYWFFFREIKTINLLVFREMPLIDNNIL